MTDNVISVKPQKRFSIGGVLCIICGLWFGCLAVCGLLGEFIDMTAALLRLGNPSLKGLIDAIWKDEYISKSFYAFANCTAELLGALSFLALGVLILMKKNIPYLAIFPLIQILILAFNVLNKGTETITWFMEEIAKVINALSDSGANVMRIIYRAAFNSGILYILPMLLAMLGYFLLLVVFLGNCRDVRVDNSSGKLRFWAVVSVIFVGGAFLGNAVIPVISGILDLLTWGTLANGLDMLFSALSNGISAFFIIVTLSFVLGWIIKPFKKKTQSK